MANYTPGPWDYVASTEHHGPYVTSNYGSTIADCYVMSQPSELSTLNGGPSKPIPHMTEMADANARLISAAPEMLVALANVQKLIAETALTGFNYKDGDWAQRLFESQQVTSRAIKAAVGSKRENR